MLKTSVNMDGHEPVPGFYDAPSKQVYIYEGFYEKYQKDLAARMGFGYRNGIGEIIYTMITARPDMAYAIVCAAQHIICPHEHHYNGLRHQFMYIYRTRTHGIYYWQTKPNMFLPVIEPPQIDSKFHDLLLDRRPSHEPL